MRHSWKKIVALTALVAAFAVATDSFAQIHRPGMPVGPSMGGPASASAGIRLRGEPKVVKERTPVFKTSTSQQSSNASDWWHGVVEFETAAEWTDEIEFDWYVYVESSKQGNQMFRCITVYVNIPKGKHNADVFLNPNTLARYGIPKYTAVVVKVNGAVVDSKSTANTPNWWNNFSPVDGVLLNRSMTPFAVLDYDDYPCIKPAVTAR